jgi:hypothetical protein
VAVVRYFRTGRAQSCERSRNLQLALTAARRTSIGAGKLARTRQLKTKTNFGIHAKARTDQSERQKPLQLPASQQQPRQLPNFKVAQHLIHSHDGRCDVLDSTSKSSTLPTNAVTRTFVHFHRREVPSHTGISSAAS